jgi:FkbM family methyltransferase
MVDMKAFIDEYNLDKLKLIAPIGQNFKMYVTPRFQQHYGNNSFERVTSRIIKNLISKVDLFIDVGAHYGYYSLLAGSTNPKCKVIAFEPVSENFQILQRNIEVNRLGNVAAVRQAVSNSERSMKMYKSTASDNCSFYPVDIVPVLDQIDVQTTSLKKVLDLHRNERTLIKIDTEGHEMQVLRGFEDALRTREDIQFVIELNPQFLKFDGVEAETLIRKIDSLGYECYFLDDVGNCLYHPEDNGITSWNTFLHEQTSYINIFCSKKGRITNALFLSHSSELNGAERSLLEQVKDLSSDFNTLCTVLLPEKGPLEELLQQAGAMTAIAPLSWWCAFRKNPDPFTNHLLNNQSLEWLGNDLQFLRNINPDIVVSNTLVFPWGALIADILKRPHIWSIHEFGVLGHGLEFNLEFSDVLQFIIKSSDMVITTSKAVQRELFPNLGASKVKTIYPRIEIPSMAGGKRDPGKSAYRLPDACHLILSGAIMESKGQEDAVRAVIELVNNRKRWVELVLVGNANPEYKEQIEVLIKKAGISEFVQFVPFQENVFPLLQSADIALVCSRMEAFGRVTLEAMLMEKAVVATNTGGPLEMIHNGKTGLLYPPGDYIALADHIETLMDDPQKRNRLAKNASEYAKKSFNRSPGVEYSKIMRSLVNRGYKDKGDLSAFLVSQYRSLVGENQRMIAEHERDLQALKIQVEEYDQSLLELNNKIAERDHGMHVLKNQLAERDQDLQALKNQIAERDRGIRNLNTRLAERELKISSLDYAISGLQQERSMLKENHARREQILQDLNTKLLEIYHSKAWKLIQKLWKMRLWLVPKGSRREKFAFISLKLLKRFYHIPSTLFPGDRDLVLIRSSNLFDKDWYLAHNPDIAQSRMDAASHFLQIGGFEGRDPSLLFKTSFYLNSYEDVKKSGMNPLLHYLKYGKFEMRQICPTESGEAPDKREVKAVIQTLPDKLVSGSRMTKLLESARKYDQYIVSISHDNYLKITGGVQLCITDHQRFANQALKGYLHIYPYGENNLAGDHSFFVGVSFDGNEMGIIKIDDLLKALKQIECMHIADIHIHHTKGMSIKALNEILSLGNHHGKFWIHDNNSLCPSSHLMRNDTSFCDAPDVTSNACSICKYGVERQQRQPELQALFTNNDLEVVAPSTFALKYWRAKFPYKAINGKVIPHLMLKWIKKIPARKRHGELRVAFLGHPLEYKGWKTWNKMVELFSRDTRYKFYHFSYQPGAPGNYQWVKTTVTGNDRTAMVDALKENQIDVALLWSITTETFSFTLHEALAAGCFILTNKLSGNIQDTIKRNQKRGLVLDNEMDLARLMNSDRLEKLIKDYQMDGIPQARFIFNQSAE